MRRALGVVVCVLAGCQAVEFQRTVPVTVGQTTDRVLVATRLPRPNLMLLLDTSGSMLLPVEPASSACPTGCGNAGNLCPSPCATRSSEATAALDGFLVEVADRFRVGLTTYPSDVTCGAPVSAQVELPPQTTLDETQATLRQEKARQVREVLQQVRPVGGTPTAAALRFLETMPGLTNATDRREDFVVLVTDGLPNCDDANPKNVCAGTPTLEQQAACACTTTSCSGTLCSRGCLDEDAAVEAVGALRARGVHVVVVGFGAEAVSGDAPRVLGALARAGGVPRLCDAAPCAQPFYTAGNAAELTAALSEVVGNIDPSPCEFVLSEAPTSMDLMSVSFEGVDVRAGAETWSWDAPSNRLMFLGPLCDRLQASTALAPVAVEVRVAQIF